MDAIGDWLEAHGLGKYTEVLVENEVDMRVLSRLSEADLVALGLPLGARRKLQAAIETLVREESPRVLTSVRDPAPRDAPERRQLTVMFCDLVDSVGLGERLDVEDYRDLLAAFRGAVVGAVERYGGFVARHQGDGLLVYFGYPQAHEDDAECAVHSGLAVVRGVESLEHAHGARLRARVGIATGPAVVGDVLSTGASERAELAALGPTPNLAARLQGEAQPGGVLISENTRALTAGFFELEALPPRTLRGISDRVTPYRVRGEAAGRSRFAARSGMRLSRFVAREEELESLARRWARVRQGRGQVVLMLGEAGIGKSRLVHQLRECADTEPHEQIALQCSPHHESSALYPLISALESTLGFAAVTGTAQRIAALGRHLEAMGETDEQILGLIADVLSLSAEGRFATVRGMAASQRREQSLRALVGYIRKRAEKAPLLCVVEDMHWADPTTRELVARLVEGIESDRVLLIATSRPGFEAPWASVAHALVLSLSRLGAGAGQRLARAVASETTTLPDEVLQAVLARAEGIPLYIEELTRAVIQTAAGQATRHLIPATLQDALLARLDVLDRGKPVAQCASVIGRVFSHDLLQATWQGSEADLAAGLEQLERAGLLVRRGEGTEARYEFKHALVLDTAYSSQLRSRRTGLHARLSHALEADESVKENQPELLAFHCEAGGRYGSAAAWWRQAGDRARKAGASQEATSHYRRGLALLEQIPPGTERTRSELRLHIGLSDSLRLLAKVPEALQGLDAVLRHASGDELDLERSEAEHLRGNLLFHLGRAADCRSAHEESLRLARQAGSSLRQAAALSGLGDAAYAQGRMLGSFAYFDECVRISEAHGLIDIACINRVMRANAYFLRLELGKGFADAEAALALTVEAKNLRHQIVANFCAYYYLEALELERARAMLQTGIELARRIGATNFEAVGLAHLARALCIQDDRQGALPIAHEAVAKARAHARALAGGWAYGALASAAESDAERARALAEGEALLASGAIGHSHFWFYRDATDVCLGVHDWDGAERYADALATFTAPEPTPWSDFYIDRARTLAALGRAGGDARQYRDDLLRLRDTAVRSGLTLGARAIAAALGGHWPGAALHSPTATGGDRRRR